MDAESINLLGRFQAGDNNAAEQIFNRYVSRLIGLAGANMSDRLKRRVDPEDIVQSVYRSFYRRSEAGDFEITKSGDLWRLLAMITVNKVRKKAVFHGRKKRDAKLDLAFNSVFDGGSVDSFLEDPAVDEAAVALDELSDFMSTLADKQRLVLELKLQGLELAEIATKAKRSERTIRRILEELETSLASRLAG